MGRLLWGLAALGLLACGDDTGTTTPSGTESVASGGGCVALCTGAGYEGGTEHDYAPVYECVCDGAGDGIAQDDCEDYCATFGVGADRSFLSKNASPNDKCVCDGT